MEVRGFFLYCIGIWFITRYLCLTVIMMIKQLSCGIGIQSYRYISPYVMIWSSSCHELTQLIVRVSWKHCIIDMCAKTSCLRHNYITETIMSYLLTRWSLGDFNQILDKLFSCQLKSLITDVPLVKLPSCECNWIFVMKSRHWFR